MSPRMWILLAGLLGASGVGLGAFQAHGLERWLTKRGVSAADVEHRSANCEVAVRYQLIHAVALLGVGLLAGQGRSALAHASGVLFLLGVLFFSGGLYLGVFTGSMLHWSIVPSGGLLLIVGWLALAAQGRP